MLSQPKVSIITPVYNSQRFLAETIESVQNQTFSDYEHLIVIDAKSSDSSEDIAKKFAQNDSRIRVIVDPKALGPACNRNLGIDYALGKFICFIDSDDLWQKDKLKRQLEFASKNKHHFCFTSFVRISEDKSKQSEESPIPSAVGYEDLLKYNFISSHTVMLEKKWVGYRRFPDTVHEDFAFWLLLLRDGTLAYSQPEATALYRKVRGSRAYNKFNAARWRWRVIRKVEHLSIFECIYYFCEYAVRGFARHLKTGF